MAMQRRAFLLLAGQAVAHASAVQGQHAEDPTGGVTRDPSYRLVERVGRVDQVLVARAPGPEPGWVLRFVAYATTPLGDRRLLVPSANDDPGLHVQGAPHETSLFVENSRETGLFITFRTAVTVRVFRHLAEGKEVVLQADPCA